MQALLFGLILRGNAATLTGLLLLIVLALLVVGSPLFIIVASRWETWRGARDWRAQHKVTEKTAF